LAGVGLAYGPGFQGLRAAWRRGDDLFVEADLPEGPAQDVAAFGVHPALLDAALHALGIEPRSSTQDVELPFSWAGASLHAAGASALRVRFSRHDEEGALSLVIADASGEPVASVEALRTRPVSPAQIHSALDSGHDSLHRVEWRTVSAASALPL